MGVARVVVTAMMMMVTMGVGGGRQGEGRGGDSENNCQLGHDRLPVKFPGRTIRHRENGWATEIGFQPCNVVAI